MKSGKWAGKSNLIFSFGLRRLSFFCLFLFTKMMNKNFDNFHPGLWNVSDFKKREQKISYVNGCWAMNTFINLVWKSVFWFRSASYERNGVKILRYFLYCLQKGRLIVSNQIITFLKLNSFYMTIILIRFNIRFVKIYWWWFIIVLIRLNTINHSHLWLAT